MVRTILQARLLASEMRSVSVLVGKDLTSNDWIERKLYDLANIAWSPRRGVATEAFILRPETLPSPSTPEDLARIVESLYAHARHWCPGFKVPLDASTFRIPALAESAGHYWAESNSDTFLRLPQGLSRRPAAIYAILAHEACHHILDLSGIRGDTLEDHEKETILAVFVCGFGEIFLQGHKHISGDPSCNDLDARLLTADQYRFAHNWVFKAQSLPVYDDEQVSKLIPADNQGRHGFFARTMAWLRNRFGSAEIVDAIYGPAHSSKSVSRTRSHQYQVVLERLGGDNAALERLVEHERRKQPYANESTLLDAVMESLERDRS